MSGLNTDAKLDELVDGRRRVDSGVWAYVKPATGLTSNTVNLPGGPARGVRVLAVGDIKYSTLDWDGATINSFTETIAAEQLPYVIPAAIYRIWVTGTTVAEASIQIGL